MKAINVIIAIIFYGNLFGAEPNEPFPSSCVMAKQICASETVTFSYENQSACQEDLTPQYYTFSFSEPSAFSFNTYGHTGTYTLYGPMTSFGTAACDQISLGLTNEVSGSLSGLYSNTLAPGYYVLRIEQTNCIYVEGGWRQRILLSSENFVCGRGKMFDCKDCIGSFSPDPGKYIVSAWVKGEQINKNSSYVNPGITVSFVGASDVYSFSPSGKIIDGWQRIDNIITIPPNATDIMINLFSNGGTCYFDDIRFVPINGSIISYVYDPVSLKLVAQLDERNYATLYEYDEEGKLIRVKKETERGIMTIQENRDNIHKQ